MAHILVQDILWWVIAVTKHALEELDSEDSEHKEEEHDNKQYIDEGWNRFKQSIYDGFDTFVLGHNSKRSKGSECSETSQEGNITGGVSLQNPSNDWEEHNDEIKNIPRILQVSSLTPVESQNNGFEDPLNHEDNRNSL